MEWILIMLGVIFVTVAVKILMKCVEYVRVVFSELTTRYLRTIILLLGIRDRGKLIFREALKNRLSSKI